MTQREERGLKFLKNLSPQLYKFNYDEVKIWLKDYVPQVPISYFENDTLWRPQEDIWARHPRSLCRARETIYTTPDSLNPFKKVSEISHVPFDKLSSIKELGRANLPGQSIFYCSNYSAVACIECLTKGFTKGFSNRKSVTMGTWEIQKPLLLAEIILSKTKLLEYRHIDEERYDKLIKHSELWYENAMKTLANHSEFSLSEDYSFELLNFFGDEFGKTDITSSKDYILSNYYCDLIFNYSQLNNKALYDGIIYPSVKYSYQDYNIALHPRAMPKLSFISADFVWVIYNSTADSETVEFAVLKTGSAIDKENIKWNFGTR